MHRNNFKSRFFRVLSLLAFLGLSGFSANAQEFFNENFNGVTSPNLPTGWEVTNTSTNLVGTAFATQTAPYSYGGSSFTMNGGGFVMSNGDIGGSGSFQNTSLTSPAFNTASASLLYFEFSQFYKDYSATPTDSAVVEIFNGSNWVKIQSLDVNSGTGTAPTVTKIEITQYKNATMKLRFRSMGSWPWFWAFDNVRVFSPVPNDVGVTGIQSPFGDCGLSSTSQVKVQISNFGSAAQTSIPVKFKINSGAVVTETFTGNLLPGTSTDYTFTTVQNLSAPGDYFTSAWTALSSDNNFINDSTKNVKATKTGSSFGNISFVGYNGDNLADLYPGWKEQTGTTPSGTTSAWRAAATAQITAFNNQTAAINLYTNSRNEWIVTPSVVPTASSGLVFKTAVTNWLTPEPDLMGSDDAVKVMVSTTCGQTWTELKTFNRGSGLTNTFTNQSIPLSAYAGQEIRLAFFATDGPTDDPEDYDFHIDSLRIKDLPAVDLSAVAITSPLSGCAVATPELKVQVTNLGTQAQTNFPICAKINNGTPVCQNFTGTIAPNETATFNFSNFTAIASPGDYQIQVYTNAAGDGDLLNNEAPLYSFQNLPVINTFPYTENFESGNGGWIPSGTFSSWALGTPAKTKIQGAGQGTTSYVTGGLGTGTYNSGEKSFVLSPCMDFTTIQNPVLEMRAWWATEYSEDGAVLQSSIDGGTSWQLVGAFKDVTNWYNDNSTDGLAGLSSIPRVAWTGGVNDNFGSNGWVVVRNELKNLGGQSNVKLRIAFGANATNAGDGFAFDALRISEKPDRDIAIASLERPQIVGCGLTDTTHIRIKVKNVGKQSLTGVNFGYRVVGRPVVNQLANITLAPDESYTYRFTNAENLSQIGTYEFQAWANVANDGYNKNDSIRLVAISKRGAFTDTIRFFTFNGNNLPVMYPGWSVSAGSPVPTLATSKWRASQAVQTARYGRQVARLNMFSNTIQDWILSPAYKIQTNAFLNFEIAATETFDTIADPTNAFQGTDDKLSIMVSQDCGDSWTEVFSVGTNSGITRDFKKFKASLAAYAGQEIRFAFYATSGPNDDLHDYDVLLDNLFIETLAPKDAGITTLNSPSISCGLSVAVPISITLKNYGATPLTNIPVSYQVNQDLPVTAIFPGPLAPQATVVYTFTQNANLSLSQPYTIRVYSSLDGDSVEENNSVTTVLNRLTAPVVSQSLAGYNGSNLSSIWNGWQEAKGSGLVVQNTSWTLGSVAGTASFKISLANANKLDWIVSPGIKLSTGNFLVFSAAQFNVGGTNAAPFDIDDSISVVVSTDCGATWKKLFKLGKTTTPALTNTLQQYSLDLAAYNNQEIRIGFRARDNTRADFPSDVYINGIQITSTLTADAAPISVSFDPPAEGGVKLMFDSTYSVLIKVNNFGSQPITNVPVGIKFPDSTYIVTNAGVTINPGQSYTFNVGNYRPTVLANNLQAKYFTGLPGDQAISNDTLIKTYSVVLPVGVQSELSETGFLLFPNPAKGEVNLQSPGAGQKLQYSIHDVLGRQVLANHSLSDSNGLNTISLKGLSPGLYTVRVLVEGKPTHLSLKID